MRLQKNAPAARKTRLLTRAQTSPSSDFPSRAEAGKKAIRASGMTAVTSTRTPLEKILVGYMAKAQSESKMSYTRLLPTHLKQLPDMKKARETNTDTAP